MAGILLQGNQQTEKREQATMSKCTYRKTHSFQLGLFHLDMVRIVRSALSRLTLALMLTGFGNTSGVRAQLQPAPALPSLSDVDSVLKLKGTTVNMNIQDGTRSSLNFGSSTSMGVSVNMSTTEGTRTSASSQLTPKTGSIVFSIGKGATAGETTADISNLKTEKAATGENSYGAQGQAKLTGVTSSLNLDLDPNKTSFSAQTETLHEPGVLNEGVKGQDGNYILQPYYQTGAQKGTGGQNSSASASTNINSATNVDINTTSFTSTFMQAF